MPVYLDKKEEPIIFQVLLLMYLVKMKNILLEDSLVQLLQKKLKENI